MPTFNTRARFPEQFADRSGVRALSTTRVSVELQLNRASSVQVGLVRAETPDEKFVQRAEPDKERPNIFHLTVDSMTMNELDNGVVEIVVRADGDPGPISAIAVESGGRRRVARPIGDDCIPSRYNDYEFNDENQGLIGPEQYVSLMSAQLAREWRSPFSRTWWFFYLLDYETHPDIRPLHSTTPMRRTSLIPALSSAVIARGELYAMNQPCDWYLPTQETQDAIKRVLECKRQIIEHCFSSIDQYKRGMIAFASGQARYQLALDPTGRSSGMWVCQPSSGYFFLYGEVALMGAQMADEAGDSETAAFWSHAAEAAILAQPLYAKAFQDKQKVAAGFGGFKTCEVKALSGSETAATIRILTPSSEAPKLSTLRQLAGKHAHEFLPGAMRPASTSGASGAVVPGTPAASPPFTAMPPGTIVVKAVPRIDEPLQTQPPEA